MCVRVCVCVYGYMYGCICTDVSMYVCVCVRGGVPLVDGFKREPTPRTETVISPTESLFLGKLPRTLGSLVTSKSECRL